MNPRHERLLDLLCDGSVGELTPAEEAEARALLAEAGPRGAWERETLEHAAAALSVAGSVHPREPMPAHLFARLEQQGLEAIGAAPRAAGPPSKGAAQPVPITRARRWPLAVAWLAAAACFVLAIGSYWLRPRQVIITKEIVGPPSATPSATTPPAPPLPEAERAALLAREGSEELPWSATKDPGGRGASGDVVWNQTEQRGFMRFRGLSKNEPTVAQYQLWIFDKTRDARYPVDGGVFDVGDDGDVVVPIHARVPVGAATLFAVTVEKPGGVVVSKREHIVLTAKAGA